MALEECQSRIAVSRIKLEERGRKATFLNLERTEFIKTKVDGCLQKQQTAADWLLTKPGVGEVIIELKGRNVSHAIKQVIATMQYWTKERPEVERIAGLIVCTQCPLVSTEVQIAKQNFLRKYGAALHIVTQNLEYKIENVLSVSGPLKG